MKSFLTLIRPLWFVALLVLFGLGLTATASMMRASAIAYDEHTQPTIVYGAPSASVIGYDDAREQAENETRNGTAGNPVIFAKSSGFVAAKTGGQPLFRAVTDAELQSIQNLNRFSTVPGSSTPIPGVQGKWFYSSLEDAQRWAGQAAARDGGPLHIIRTSVPESVSPAWSQPWVDGIQNPALFHRLENLNGPITVIPPPIP